MKYRHLVIHFLEALIVCLSVAIVFTFLQPDSHAVCTDLHIEIADSALCQYVNQTDIEDMLDEQGLELVGIPTDSIDCYQIEQLLLTNDMIKDVNSFKSVDDALHIRVTQRVPRYRIAGKENYYVDTDRRIMPINPRNAIYMPVVTGDIDSVMATGELYDFVDYIDSDAFWGNQIEQIVMKEDGRIFIVPRIGSGIVILGTLNNFQEKLNRMHRFYTGVMQKNGWPTYKTIDLQYKNQVICRK